MKSLIGSIAKKTAYFISALIVLAALVVIFSRFLSPYVDSRRGELEKIASDVVGSPVTIDNASITWFQYQPGVALNNVTIHDKQTNEPILQLRVVKVFMSIPKSVWARKMVPGGILISGADLVIKQEESGDFVLQGFPSFGGYNKEPFKNESKIKDVAAWLSVQPAIFMRDIDIRFTGRAGIKRFVTLYNLKLENSDNTHSLMGKAILHQELSTELSIAARWDGLITELDKVTGKIYINLSGMSLSQWFQGLSFKDWEIKKGFVSAKIWASWRDGGFKRIQSSFQLLDVDLLSHTNNSSHSINRFSGEVGWKQEGNNQIIAGDDLLIDWASRLWPVSSFYLKLAPDANQHLTPVILNLGFIDIVDTRALLSASPAFLPDNVTKLINDLNLSGNLENISITFTGDADNPSPVMMQGHFSRLGIQSYHDMPAVKNLSGAFVWKNAAGSLSLQSNKTEVLYDSLFNAPILFEQLTGDVLWQKDAHDEWKFVFKSIGALNDDAALNLSGYLLLPSSESPDVNLSANFTVHDVAHISRYLPAKIMSKDLVQWLSHAFIVGEAQSGSLILRGKLNEFPYDHDNGSFVVATAVSNVRLHYAPNWPDISNISGNVQFSGRRILIDVDKARIMEIEAGRIHGEIPYLGSDKPAVLTVYTTPIHTDFSRGMKFLHQSPLEKTIGRMFKNIELTGPIELGLALTVPLQNPDETEVKGAIDLANANLKLVPWKLNISKLSGKVNFTERTTDGAAIQGVLFDKPLRLDLDTITTANNKSYVRATVSNNMNLDDIERWLKIPFSSIAKGSANVTTTINLAADEPIDVHLDSNLTGITLDLPEQYTKAADDVRQFSSDIIVAESAPIKIKLNYAELINAALILDRKKDNLDLVGVDLRLGKGEAEWPQGKGLYITGTISDLNEEKIKTYLDMSNSGSDIRLQLRLIDVVIDKLDLYGIKLSQPRIQLVPANKSLSLTITNPEITGKIDIPVPFTVKGRVVADLDRINIDALTGGSSEVSTIIARDLPQIEFSANSVTYRNAVFNNVRFNTQPAAYGLTIPFLTIQSSNFNLRSSGSWQQYGSNNSTNLQGKASSKNVSALLNSIGFDVHNFIASNGDFNFDLSWRNPPSALSLASLSGTASFSIGKGRIVEVSQASEAKMDLGRMLNLFSLQSIPRRLSGDFSDVFMKGYSFDTIKADFNFSHGDANTNNLQIDGALAKVLIRGKIGLAKHDFDLILSVTPYVTSSIPVAATLLTGQPVIGVAAWAVNKVIGGEVSKVATYYYSVTGSWQNPVWNTIPAPRRSTTH